MNEGTFEERTVKGSAGKPDAAVLRGKGKLFLGIDVGSTSSDVVILDEVNKVLLSDYRRTKGRPIETLAGQLEDILRTVRVTDIVLAAGTGTAGRLIAKILGIPFINEVPAQATAVSHFYPQKEKATIIEMGGQDSKLIFIERENGQSRVRDFALNTVCAAGTGSFLDQQAQRLGVDIENEFGKLALESKSVPQMAGRCSVFAKSDMIHLQQQATPVCDIVAGLCMALARNLKGNLGCGREFAKPIVFTGGVAANAGVVRALEKVFELREGELLVPKEHFFTGAIGAVLAARSKGGNEKCEIKVGKLYNYLDEQGSVLANAPRREALRQPKLVKPVSRVYKELLAQADGPIDAYLGVDVGSISTNVAVIDEQKRVLSKVYLMTAGRPLEAVRQGLEIAGKEVAGKVRILGAATTGSGRYLTGDFIGADVVINEITAQAAGAAIVNPKVDTIFEIGGQDSKYISLENGVVVDFEMNHACAAGTGSFLEEQAQRLGIRIENEFAEKAFSSESPIKLGERCTVFMESDLLSFQQQGAKTAELVAGLSYSIVSNYLNRVVGRRKIGENICFQGGTAFNRAVWAAFEQATGKTIMVPDHHEVTGAIGAAAIAAEHVKSIRQQGGDIKSNFKGFEKMAHVEYSVESFTCEYCANGCEIKKVELGGPEPLYYGSRCDRYNVKKKKAVKKGFGAFEYRREMMLKFAGLSEQGNGIEGKRGKIGIPMALVNWQMLPMFGQFFKELGFEVVLSGWTDKRIIRKGVELVTAQPCFPVKVAYGHVAELIEKKVDYIFIPSIVSMAAVFEGNKHNQLCPYVQSFVYQVQTAFADKMKGTKILTGVLHFGEGSKFLEKDFVSLGKKISVRPEAVRKAIAKGLWAQQEFEKSLRKKGLEILYKVGEDEKLFVLISRPYNGYDEGVNLRLPRKLAELGVEMIPMEMLDLKSAELSDAQLHGSVYWSYGQKILRAAEIIKRDKRLFGIYLSNFSCGPDSFLQPFFKDIMGRKPCLQLELDEHSADAGVITRLEAFLESLKNYRETEQQETAKPAVVKAKITKEHKLYIPYMSDVSYAIAAAFRANGQDAEVMPIANEETLLQGRAFTSGKECLPCAITTGDMLKVLKKEGKDKPAFFMPGGCGPCRFGMYNCMHKLILKYVGAEGVPIVAPNQDTKFYGELAAISGASGTIGFLKEVWTAAVGMDLLIKVISKIRPFAKDRKLAQAVYEKCRGRWVETVGQKRCFDEKLAIMGEIAEHLKWVELDYTRRKAKVGIVGEIYVRSHPFANSNIVGRLEELGVVCEPASLAEWIYYTNFTRQRSARNKKKWKGCLESFACNYFEKRIEKQLAKPLEKRFGKVAEGAINDVLKLAKPYINDSFEGEAVLSIGKAIELYHHGASGVVNVMPFTCMPSTIVSTQTMRVSEDCGDMPILNLSFDGQEDSTLTTRLEAFVEQVQQRENAAVNVEELLRV